jgi:exonuclease III
MALRALTDTNTLIVGNLNTPLSPINRSSRQNVNKETTEVLHTLDQVDMVDICRVLHPASRQYTFLSEAHGAFSKINHILGHLGSLIKFKKIEINSCVISEQNRIKVDLNNKRNPEKLHTHGD